MMPTFRRRVVMPSGGDVLMRCGKCGATDYSVHVRPSLTGSVARVTNLVCNVCQKVFELNDKAQLGGAYTPVEHAKGADHRAEMNQRTDA
jgi:hypothetical protein